MTEESAQSPVTEEAKTENNGIAWTNDMKDLQEILHYQAVVARGAVDTRSVYAVVKASAVAMVASTLLARQRASAIGDASAITSCASLFMAMAALRTRHTLGDPTLSEIEAHLDKASEDMDYTAPDVLRMATSSHDTITKAEREHNDKTTAWTKRAHGTLVLAIVLAAIDVAVASVSLRTGGIR